MDGLLLINKDSGLTSQAVLTKLKHILNEPKIGHCGTLDPIAKGVLVVLLGQATKLSNFLLEENKEYEAEVTLGIKTDTFDKTGNVLEEKEVNVTDSDIDKVLQSFLGESMQTPPIYSAIKIDGKKLYDYARSGKEVEFSDRLITVYSINRTSNLTNNKFTFRTKVSKGTYIRSLINDVGIKLNTFATMSRLTRTSSGNFSIKDSYTLDDVKNGNFKVISMLDAISIKKIELDQETYKKVSCGGKISLKQFENVNDKQIAFTYNNKLVAIYERYESYYGALRVWN